MATTATTVAARAAALLNDPSQTIYTNTVLLPLIQIAYDELEDRFRVEGVPALSKISATITHAASTTQPQNLDISTLTDFIEPIIIEERDTGSTDPAAWTPLIETTWLVNQAQSSSLNYYSWREQKIYLLGAIQSRDVRVKYHRDLTAVAAIGDTIEPSRALNFLAFRTAALAAKYITQNDSRFQALSIDATNAIMTLVESAIKLRQALPATRKPYSAFRRSRYNTNT